MTISLGFFLDANLNNPATANLIFEQAKDGSAGPQTRVVYIGSSAVNRKFESEINPGVSPIVLSVVDSEPGQGQQVSNVRLALSPDELINTAPGSPLLLPATILSGTTNAMAVYIQVEDSNRVVSTDTSLSLVTNTIVEIENT